MLASGAVQEGALDKLRPTLSGANRRAVEFWNIMGGCIDWTALPILCELHEVDDFADLLWRLIAIRDA